MALWLWLLPPLLATALSQIPGSPCPEYFSYQPQSGRYIGHIRMPNTGSSLKISISSAYALPSNLLERATGTNDYWVHFPKRKQLPVVNWIDINNRRVCTNEEAAPRTYNHRSQYSRSFSSGNSWPGSGLDWDLGWGNDVIPRDKSSPSVSRNRRREVQTKQDVKLSRSSPSSEVCGVSDIPPTPLVQLGKPTVKGEWPWLAAIFNQKYKTFFLCGGSLVDLSHVVTAAHCVMEDNARGTKVPRKPEDLYVRLGTYNLEAIYEHESQLREVRRILIHEGYNPVTNTGDIALLELESPLKYSKYVRPICLWPRDQSLGILAQKETWVVGWGRDENGKMATKMPMKVRSKIVKHSACRRLNPLSHLLNEKSFCAGFKNGSGPCSGDSGGGLMSVDRTADDQGVLVDRYYLTGVVSLGTKNGKVCDLFKYYTYYTNVNKYLGWLREYVDG